MKSLAWDSGRDERLTTTGGIIEIYGRPIVQRSPTVATLRTLEDRCLNILFVCLGNICRSPVAAGIMKRIYEERSYAGFIDSAGTADWNAGSPADPRAVRVALESGIDVRDHRARQIQRNDFSRFDLIVVMDGNNYKAVSKIAPETMRHKIRRLLEYSDDHNRDIPDPYNGDEGLFRSTFHIIYEGCINLAAELDSVPGAPPSTRS